jgi:hypothetical protein
MFKFKIKPKVKLSKLLKDKDLELESLDTEIRYETELSEDVSMKANLGMDLISGDVKSANVSFIKKF